MARGQVESYGGAKRHARYVDLLDPNGAEEGRDLVGIAIELSRPRRTCLGRRPSVSTHRRQKPASTGRSDSTTPSARDEWSSSDSAVSSRARTLSHRIQT